MVIKRSKRGKYSDLLRSALPALIALTLSAPAGAEMVDRIAAEVNGEIILYSELQERLFQMKAAGVLGDLSGKEAQATALENLIDEKLIIQVGKEGEIKITEREIDEAVEKLIKRMGLAGKDELEMLLARDGLSMDRYREMLRDQILARKVISMEVQSQVILTDDDINEYYEKHRDELKTKPTIRVRHIILMIKDGGSGAEEAIVLEKIKRIRNEIINGLDFAQAAKKYSEGPSGPNGGDLGEVVPGQMVKSFEDAAFSLEPGMISRPVRSRFGYHLIKVDSRTESKPIPLEEVRQEIENRLFQQLISEVREDWLGRIKQQAFIDIKMELN